jgi:parallel beta-helix repeat protein
MQALKKTLSVLALPAIACLVAACEHAGLPTEPASDASGVASFSSSTVHWVNDDGGVYVPPGNGCGNPGYPTIQSAVNAAAPGDRIKVCTGVYQEQVTFPSGKDNIQLLAVSHWNAVIKAPPAMVAGQGGFAIVRITSAQNVTISGFTITGPGPGPCGTLHYGVRVEGGGSANVLGNHIIDIRDNPLSGCQNGVAVGAGRASVFQGDVTTGSARIIGNVIERYQKNGPTISNVGSSGEIAHNRIFGIGPTGIIAQNGIQVSAGATASIRHNFVAQNIYTGAFFASTGILLFTTGPVPIERNSITSNDVDLYMFDAGAGSMASHNRVRASTYDGVVVFNSDQLTVANNRIDENGGPGIGVYDAQSNTLDQNQVEDNDDSGILLDGAMSNTVSSNHVRDNGTESLDMTDGIRLNPTSSGNTIRDNHLRHNVTHDCHDFGTANTWTNNHGETSVPFGLCGQPSDDAFQTSTTFGWDPNYPWYESFGDAAVFDWVEAYSAFDTEGLLKLLPAIKVNAIVHGPGAVSPDR